MWTHWSVFSDRDKLFIYKILKKHSYTSDCVDCKLYYIVIIMQATQYYFVRLMYLFIQQKNRRRVVRLVLHRIKSPF